MAVADFTGQPAVFIPNKWPISPKYPQLGGAILIPPKPANESTRLLIESRKIVVCRAIIIYSTEGGIIDSAQVIFDAIYIFKCRNIHFTSILL